jgi:hypothetical protein
MEFSGRFRSKINFRKRKCFWGGPTREGAAQFFNLTLRNLTQRWVKLDPSKSNVTLMEPRKVILTMTFPWLPWPWPLPLELKRPFRGVEPTLFPKGRKWPLGLKKNTVKSTLLNLQCRPTGGKFVVADQKIAGRNKTHCIFAFTFNGKAES